MDPKLIEEAIRFHGHLCPGLAFGYRAAVNSLEVFGVAQGTLRDTHVVIAENDVCGLDGIQYITGCTVGNDGLIINNIGKQAFRFISKKTGQGIRILLKTPLWKSDKPLQLHAKVKTGFATAEEKREFFRARTERGQEFLELSDDELFTVSEIVQPITEKVRLFPTVNCSVCGEAVMEQYVLNIGNNTVCQSCDQLRIMESSETEKDNL